MTDNPEQLNYRAKEVKRVTWVGLIINVLLSGFKMAAGIIGNSQAIVADAVHSLSDLTTDIAVLLGVEFWDRPPDEKHPYGHKKIETLVTLGIGIALFIVSTGILWSAILNIKEKHSSSPGIIAFIAALVSIFTKEILYRWTVKIGKKIKCGAVVANAWHHRSDAFSSIPAAIAVGAATISPSWAVSDHIGAIIVSLFIYKAAYDIVHPEFSKLLDTGVPEKQLEHIKSVVMRCERVKSVHNIRSRYMGGSSVAVDLHLLVDENMTVKTGHDVSEIVKKRIRDEVEDVVDVVVHIEPYQTHGDDE